MTWVLKVNENEYDISTGQGQVGSTAELPFGAKLMTRGSKVDENRHERLPNFFIPGISWMSVVEQPNSFLSS